MSTRRIESGFTLVEMMVAMAVGLIVLLVSATILGQTGESYERVGGGISAEREARALLTQLSADLATAHHHPEAVFHKSEETWPVDRAGFLSLQPVDAQSQQGRIGDLCAVHYYVQDLPYAGRTVRCLMRGFRESGETFEAVKKGDLSPLFTPHEKDEPVAFGVLSFQARPKVRAAGGSWMDWNRAAGTAPEALDVRLVIARRDLTAKLRTPADWSGAGQIASLLGQPSGAASHKGLEVFATTLRFGNHASR